ncbi:MAG: hypothetical protein ACKOC5_12115, partial [Chloroflexota bacterium]
PGAARRRLRSKEPQPALDAELRTMAAELDRLARKLKLPAVAHLDGRYPLYIVFSLHRRLAQVYGDKAAALVEGEMTALAQAVSQRPQWGGRAILADDPGCTTPLGLEPLRSGDPWDIKLFLEDLDQALARSGERVGALLIVGGPEIVPFHHLPNPVDDQDLDVPSDNPYACRDEIYFLPEWPIGRLPGGAEPDARLLLDGLRRIRESHERRPARRHWWQRLSDWLRERLARPAALRRDGYRARSLGYTAAVWRQPAAMVYRPISFRRAIQVSPPLGAAAVSPAAASDSSADPALALESLPGMGGRGLNGKTPDLNARLAYFNLHGVVDGPEWFGQRELQDSASPDYPVALRPSDISLPGDPGARPLPLVIFTEACYGMHLENRRIDQSIALRFLQGGVLAIAGCTCMAYGSLEPKLAAADYLGHSFWRFLLEGIPAGEALRQARLALVNELSGTQGYLDGEDQKTLISFILYGDPLAQVTEGGWQPKSLRPGERAALEIPAVCERIPAGEALPLSPEVMASVRRVVARHLPGMSDARLTLVQPQVEPGCETPPAGKAGKAHRHKSVGAGRLPRLVTLSKQVRRAEGVHQHVARVTLDEDGTVVKLVVSR